MKQEVNDFRAKRRSGEIRELTRAEQDEPSPERADTTQDA